MFREIQNKRLCLLCSRISEPHWAVVDVAAHVVNTPAASMVAYARELARSPLKTPFIPQRTCASLRTKRSPSFSFLACVVKFLPRVQSCSWARLWEDEHSGKGLEKNLNHLWTLTNAKISPYGHGCAFVKLSQIRIRTSVILGMCSL